jgi:hypothetical protein
MEFLHFPPHHNRIGLIRKSASTGFAKQKQQVFFKIKSPAAQF